MLPKLIEEYHAQQEPRKLFLKALNDDIRTHLRNEAIRFVDTPWRVKAESSLLKKVRKNPAAYKSVSDVHDFCGLRVITYLREDIEHTLSALARRYELTEVKDRSPLDPTQFGYLSHHARIKFHQASPFRGQFSDFYAEIQVRTILQHAWAEIEHDLGYKNDVGIPSHLRRRFSLLSGLLEIADREFDELRVEISTHVRSLGKRSENDWFDVSVDSHSLKHFCENSSLLRASAERVRVNADAAPHNDHEYARNVSALDHLRIETLGGLDRLLEERGGQAVAMATMHLVERGKQTYFADADLIDYIAICEAASLGETVLQQLLTQTHGTGSETEDAAVTRKWYQFFISTLEVK
jgi:putative GTP pyrophosphokinase